MHAYLYIGAESDRTEAIKTRLHAARISPFDTITITMSETTIGIKDVREFIAKLQLIPSQSPLVAGLIADASILTKEAQQALLKTLEEPPPTAIIILGITQQNTLLPTILSRCECIVLKEKNEPTASSTITEAFIDDLLVASSGLRFSLLSVPCKTKEDSKLFLRDAIALLRKKNIEHTAKNTTNIPTILARLINLYSVNQASMNMQLLIESAFL